MSLIQQWRRTWATPSLLRATLFCLPLVDELVGGIPVLTLPLAREELHFSYAQVGLIFTIADLTGLVVNPALNATSDHWSKPRLVMGGLLGLALGFALASSSPTFGWLLLAFVIMGATNGAVLGLGGAILIDQVPAAAMATTTRWVFLATIGDLLGPLLVAGTVALQGSWRLLMGCGALIWLTVALFLSAQRFTALQTKAVTDAEEELPMWQTIRTNLREGFQTPRLLCWLLLAALPALLDEMFLGFAALFLTDQIGVAPQMISLTLLAPTVGGLLSLAWLERGRKLHAPSQLLGVAALLALSGLVTFATATASWVALFALFLVGLGALPWYTIAQAQALAALPGRAGTVGALQALFAPIEITAPLLIGLVAERWGIQAGVTMFLIAPLLALLLRPRP
ncbi:MAG: MFS transporter [Caldilinea sp. CFX5]|nr:MFS transporter [Caldilinea sp. CFX5]